MERNAGNKEFVDDDISESEKKLIRNAVGRNQLTGNNRFIDEIEMRTEMRVEQRGRGEWVMKLN